MFIVHVDVANDLKTDLVLSEVQALLRIIAQGGGREAGGWGVGVGNKVCSFSLEIYHVLPH